MVAAWQVSVKRRVLVCGAGAGGLTAAFWMHRWGFLPTVIESASGPRDGGYLLDFFGAGYDVAELMGLTAALHRSDMQIDEVSLVDKRGRRRTAFDTAAARASLAGRAVSVSRGTLTRILFDAVKERLPIVFDERLQSLQQQPQGVDVVLERGGAQSFDLVIGADGVHSRVRELVFGARESFEHYLGHYTASFTVDAVGEEPTLATFASPGRRVAVYPLADGRRAAAFMFARRSEIEGVESDRGAQVRALREAFQDHGWKTAELLQSADSAADFVFEAAFQVRMRDWWHERVALVGDACCCPSFLAGQGASLAMACAYVLAGELNEAAGGHRSAFTRYQHLMKDHVDRQQALATRARRPRFVSAGPLDVAAVADRRRTSFLAALRVVRLRVALGKWSPSRGSFSLAPIVLERGERRAHAHANAQRRLGGGGRAGFAADVRAELSVKLDCHASRNVGSSRVVGRLQADPVARARAMCGARRAFHAPQGANMKTTKTILRCMPATTCALLVWGSACAGTEAAKKNARADAPTSASVPQKPAPAPAVVAPPSPAHIACAEREVVRFAFNSVELDDASRASLSAFAKCLGGSRPTALVIEGHCDERGTTEFNIALGARRADAIRDYLARLGVDRGVMKTVSYGEERPADSKLSEEAWAKNRRGELVTSR
jgi:2-polyprenyl-6-methoxyphenol hydroxylase-like FAD-dependent oxidoreductase/outer membrane protein OmpA-like peptidoglycan-associated protein